MAAMGQSNSATFLRPITEGHVNAVARPRHRGRTSWVWDVEIADDEGRTVRDGEADHRRAAALTAEAVRDRQAAVAPERL